MMFDPFSDVMSTMNNAERAGKGSCKVNHVSKVAINVLQIMKDAGYIKDFKLEDARGDKSAIVELSGRINKCSSIVPRFFVKKAEYELWEKRYLPAVDAGILIVSTSKGMKNHREVRGKIGGSIVAYVF